MLAALGTLYAALGAVPERDPEWIALTVAGLAVSVRLWIRQRRPASGSAESDVFAAASRLALDIRAQLSASVARRDLTGPPLTVSWRPAHHSLVQPWSHLRRLATSGGGWTYPATAATGPDDLAGGGGELGSVFRRVPTGRLIVLGEPGSGKTVLLVQLVLDLLARREDGDPVPVLVSLGTWDPGRQHLRDWLAVQIEREYPDLSRTTRGGGRARAMLAAGLVLPVLDGLDEIYVGGRAAALAAINAFLVPGAGVVLSCRAQAFRRAVRPPHREPLLVEGAAAVHLKPLKPAVVATYLTETAGEGHSERWAPVRAALAVTPLPPPAARALSTPLTVGLARAVYNPRPGEAVAELPDPARLCDTDALPDRPAVERHLLGSYVAAVYRNRTGDANRWPADQAETYLTFLANHLEYRLRSTSMAWWELARATPLLLWGLSGAVLMGSSIGLSIGLASGLSNGFTSGLVATLIFGMFFGVSGFMYGIQAGIDIDSEVGFETRLFNYYIRWSDYRTTTSIPFIVADRLTGGALRRWFLRRNEVRRDPTSPVRIVLRRPRLPVLRGGLLFGGAVGMFIGLMVNMYADVSAGVAVGLAVGVVLGPLLFIALDVARGVAVDVERPADPITVLAHDRATAVARGLIGGIVASPAVFVAVAQEHGLVASALYGLGEGALIVVYGTFFTGLGSAWGALGVARLWLAWHGRMPLQIMDFLADARERGVLRYAGASYQFNHIELQRLLAERAVAAAAQAKRVDEAERPPDAASRRELARTDTSTRTNTSDGADTTDAVMAPVGLVRTEQTETFPAGNDGNEDRPGAAEPKRPPEPPAPRNTPDEQDREELSQDEQTLRRFRATLGAGHSATLLMATKVARAHYDRGDYQAAWVLDEETLARRREGLGNDHLDTLASTHNLARDLVALGDRSAARELFEDALSRKRAVLGDDHPSTLTTAAALADVLWDLGERGPARAAFEDVLARKRQVFGDDHPSVLLVSARLAELLRELGEHGAARHVERDVKAGEHRWDFFVSYTRVDVAWAEWIAWQLEADGYKVLLQKWDMVPGTNWMFTMQEGMIGAERTIAVLSDAYLSSVYGRHEWMAAVQADPHGFDRKLVPVRVADCPRPGLLAGVVTFDLYGMDQPDARITLLQNIEVLRIGRAKPDTPPSFPSSVPSVEPMFPGPGTFG